MSNPRKLLLFGLLTLTAPQLASADRDRIDFNAGWRFSRFTTSPDSLSYNTLKPWLLPSSNDFTASAHRVQPAGTPPGGGLDFVQAGFNDSAWESVNLPHDWAVKGPFGAPGVGGGMGRLPSNGVGWYRRKATFPAEDAGRSVFLDVDGAMSYAAVWLNGNLVGGWPYGYASFRLDLTPFVKAGEENLLAIRVDNALDSSRWYPGAGIYRNLWLTKTDTTHVSKYGTYITTPSVQDKAATVNLRVEVENKGTESREVKVATSIYEMDPTTGQPEKASVAKFNGNTVTVAAGSKQTVNDSVTINNPNLWGPIPAQKPNLYVAITTLFNKDGTTTDTYATPFGIRTITYDPLKGVLINNMPTRIQGTNNHHDLGSLGSAFNYRAAERQLQMLQEMGCNALRTSHNPPAPEFLDLADRLGFVVLDEIFDVWERRKTTNDFHLIFPDWHEADLRLFIRRDRNHPSVIAWSFGNEIGEQGSAAGGTIGQELHDIIKSEDDTRPSTSGMNSASPGSAFANVMDIESLNYQGEGMGTSTSSSFPAFQKAYPKKMIWTSESSSALSSRGTYLFPVTSGNSATVGNTAGAGANGTTLQVSSYDLYAPSWGSSPDKVFGMQDRHAFAAGEFVWTGWDYLGEPTPHNAARSSYFGIIDLAGFKKDRFYLYQSRWRSELPMAHILPHWTWPGREGQVTPVHVYSSGDEAELFVNGKSAGRVKKGSYAYRFRWDNVTYSPGDLRVVTYKGGKEWAVDAQRTTGEAVKLNMTVDRSAISADGYDLAFVTVAVVDNNGDTVPQAMNSIAFSISGPGQIVSTDNGDPTDMTAFPSRTRKAFSGLAMAIVRANPGVSGQLVVSAASNGLAGAQVTLSTTK